MRGQRRQAIVRLFERDPLLVAHHPAQEVGRERAAGEELGVRAAVRNAGEGELRVVDDLGLVLGVELRLRLQELRLQIGGERRDRPSRRPDACLLPVPIWPSDLPTYFSSSGLFSTHCTISLASRPPMPGRVLVERVAICAIALDRRAHRRILHLGESSLPWCRWSSRATPVQHIVEIPVLQREGESAAHGPGLAENRQTLGARLMQPARLLR